MRLTEGAGGRSLGEEGHQGPREVVCRILSQSLQVVVGQWCFVTPPDLFALLCPSG